MRAKKVNEDVNFERGQEPKDSMGIGRQWVEPIIFVDEGHFDEYFEEDQIAEDGNHYDGVDSLIIYGAPEEVDPYDSNQIEKLSEERDEFIVLGKAKVGFNEGEPNIISLDEEAVKNEISDTSIEFVWPRL